jgi:heme/copper-type cytochrome/quinol oxidase subunit 2
MIGPNRQTTRTLAVLTLAILFTVAGCARQTRAPASQDRSVTVVVENTTISFLTIWAVPRTGLKVRVGEAPPNQTTTLQFTPVLTGPYRLVAEQLSGAQMASNDVFLNPGETVHWDLTSNIAT